MKWIMKYKLDTNSTDGEDVDFLMLLITRSPIHKSICFLKTGKAQLYITNVKLILNTR